jgi:CheY-like chemotaxis protein
MPAAMRHAVDRLRRERDRALAQSSLLAFHECDRELGALGSHLEGREWRHAAAADETATVADVTREPVIDLMNALGGGRYAGEASEAAAARVRLTAPVAAVLRAALDWLFGASEQRGLLRVSEDAGTVEVECRGVDPAGLLPAHEVIAAVGGCLGPASGGERGAWTLRLPAVTERESFLMLQQADLRLALPWANVLRIQLETPEGEAPGALPLAPLTPLTGTRRARPVVTVGLGLRCGSLAADRLVWRLAAEPAYTDQLAPAGTTHAVQSDGGEVFWVIDVAKLMRDVPLPPAPELRAAAAPGAAPAREVTPPAPRAENRPAAPAPTAHAESRPVAPAPAPRAGTPAATSLRLLLLGPEHVEPFAEAPAPGPALAVAAPPGPAAPSAPTLAGPPAQEAHADAAGTSPAPGAAPAPSHARRALVAEDSFMARIFLMRLLQAQGYDVHSVGTARELRGALSGEPWALVCVDVELPDARGEALIREVSDSQLEQPEAAVVIALVRDWVDQQEAARGGVHRVLLKPFAQGDVALMLERAGLPAARAR